MVKSIELEFQLTQKEILNSNSIPGHFIVKGNMVSHLRAMAAERAVLEFPEEAQAEVREKLEYLRLVGAIQLQRTKLKKKLTGPKSLFVEDVDAELEARFPYPPKPEFTFAPLLQHFTLRLTVFAPTRRRLDPPNLWPSLKALGDGLTDSGLWPDDDFGHLLETSFRYGGLSELKGLWRLVLTITEVTDLSDFQLEPELPAGKGS